MFEIQKNKNKFLLNLSPLKKDKTLDKRFYNQGQLSLYKNESGNWRFRIEYRYEPSVKTAKRVLDFACKKSSGLGFLKEYAEKLNSYDREEGKGIGFLINAVNFSHAPAFVNSNSDENTKNFIRSF